ncbi:ABC-2 type transport system ATP-binding protein [Isoptericola sp. CG 20/1183]|uniref:ABC-2 type transport system ATP-binding protein n=1 Tax=Isoptericola halotolerans TaxID=300560 RepID=A0ABX5ELB6_9MICO|nr:MULTISPECIES: ABC transporter ATP-binding protein [Isoptericola]MCK0117235.1 ABC transporter ATP-binding protein [Isoptericola sp. S6320L]PRZ09657.1 ABC-2 type transport system ATP-binding protein [Isoptericola sp. CG 20/1183]PRZ10458.1 ABC-2 type transport system ATP-binding protein [Isoptericola halotolerans]
MEKNWTGPALRTRGLVVERGGRTVVDGLDLEVPAGQVIGLLGPSGSGKTTLMRALVGVQDHVAGEVTVLGEPAGTAALRRRVGYVTQAASVYTDLTVAQNLRYFARLSGLPPSDAEAAVAGAVATVDLGGHERQVVGTLSGGERSRVSLAAALVGDPDVLVLDEPTVGLDPVLRRDLWATFRTLAAEGRTLLVSSHVMDEATQCDRLLLLRDGALVADTTPDELLATTGAPDAERAFLVLIDRATQEAR